MQFVPFPLMKPRHPSSFHIFARPFPTESLYSSRPTLCIWKRIFNLSRGDTTVRDTAPATPPAQKAANTGCAIISRSCNTFGPYFGLRVSLPDCATRWSALSDGWNALNLQQTFRVELQAMQPRAGSSTRIQISAHKSWNNTSSDDKRIAPTQGWDIICGL